MRIKLSILYLSLAAVVAYPKENIGPKRRTKPFGEGGMETATTDIS